MNGFRSNNNSMTGTENKNIDVIYNRSLTTTNINSDFITEYLNKIYYI